MELKFLIFIFVHLFGSDERRRLTNIKQTKYYKNILFQLRDTIVTMSKSVTKNSIYASFIV